MKNKNTIYAKIKKHPKRKSVKKGGQIIRQENDEFNMKTFLLNLLGSYVEDKHNLSSVKTSSNIDMFLNEELNDVISKNVTMDNRSVEKINDFITKLNATPEIETNFMDLVIKETLNNREGYFFDMYKNGSSNFLLNVLKYNFVLDTNIHVIINKNNYSIEKGIVDNLLYNNFQQIFPSVKQFDKNSYMAVGNYSQNMINTYDDISDVNSLLDEETREMLTIFPCNLELADGGVKQSQSPQFDGFYYFIKNSTCQTSVKEYNGNTYCKTIKAQITTNELISILNILFTIRKISDFVRYISMGNGVSPIMNMLKEICDANGVSNLNKNWIKKLCRMVCDLKRVSDWTIVRVCKENNYLFMTNDRLCGVYSILQGVQTILKYDGYVNEKRTLFLPVCYVENEKLYYCDMLLSNRNMFLSYLEQTINNKLKRLKYIEYTFKINFNAIYLQIVDLIGDLNRDCNLNTLKTVLFLCSNILHICNNSEYDFDNKILPKYGNLLRLLLTNVSQFMLV